MEQGERWNAVPPEYNHPPRKAELILYVITRYTPNTTGLNAFAIPGDSSIREEILYTRTTPKTEATLDGNTNFF